MPSLPLPLSRGPITFFQSLRKKDCLYSKQLHQVFMIPTQRVDHVIYKLSFKTRIFKNFKNVKGYYSSKYQS